jgi:HEAT repeat protein
MPGGVITWEAFAVEDVEAGGLEYAVEYAGRRRTLGELLADLRAADTAVRARAAGDLGHLAWRCHCAGVTVPAAAVSGLLDVVLADRAKVRRPAAIALALAAATEGVIDAFPHLPDRLAGHGPARKARPELSNAVWYLAGLRQAVPFLCRMLRAGSRPVREAASAALERTDLSGRGVEGELRAGVSDESPVVRTWVCWSLWRLTGGAGELVPVLLKALADEQARVHAARLLCRMKGEASEALPHLLQLLDDPMWQARLQAVRATMHIPCGDELALPVLEALRSDEHVAVRGYAEHALKDRGRGGAP